MTKAREEGEAILQKGDVIYEQPKCHKNDV